MEGSLMRNQAEKIVFETFLTERVFWKIEFVRIEADVLIDFAVWMKFIVLNKQNILNNNYPARLKRLTWSVRTAGVIMIFCSLVALCVNPQFSQQYLLEMSKDSMPKCEDKHSSRLGFSTFDGIPINKSASVSGKHFNEWHIKHFKVVTSVVCVSSPNPSPKSLLIVVRNSWASCCWKRLNSGWPFHTASMKAVGGTISRTDLFNCVNS